MRKPDFFIIGAPKCGTTALATYLAEHPNIELSHPKEPHYFCKDLKAGGLPVVSDEEYVRKFFPRIEESSATTAGEASVWYLYSDIAVPNILRFQPKAKFIVMLRSPVEMAYSLHSMLSFQGQEDEKNFLRAWQLQNERRIGRRIPDGLWLDTKMLLYKDVCSLGIQLRRVYQRVSADRVHVVLQEELAQAPQRLYRGALEFLGVSDDGREDFSRFNAGRKVNSKVLVYTLRTPVVIGTVILLKRLLGLRTLGFGRPDLPMSAEVHGLLTREFRQEIDLLEQLLHRDLGHWRRRPGVAIE